MHPLPQLESYAIRTFEIDCNQQLTVPALVRLMQETAMQQVLELNISVWDLEQYSLAWVLIRKRIDIERLPILGEKISIHSYPTGADRVFTYRDFRVYDEAGLEIASACTTWLLMNTETRQMSRIPAELLACAKITALNMHGSLLPKYRGRAPVNWAILHGETQTGATLHMMEVKPDAGDIVGQSTVSIGPNETATDVFGKVSQAAVTVINLVLPELIQGHIPRKPNNLGQGSYFGGRKPADGQILWHQTAQQVHNLVRAVAPPYPGAFTDWQGQRMIVARTSLEGPFPRQLDLQVPGIQVVDNQVFGICGDQKAVVILDWFPANS
jgi:acyl-CoA thioesterase FadM